MSIIPTMHRTSHEKQLSNDHTGALEMSVSGKKPGTKSNTLRAAKAEVVVLDHMAFSLGKGTGTLHVLVTLSTNQYYCYFMLAAVI